MFLFFNTLIEATKYSDLGYYDPTVFIVFGLLFCRQPSLQGVIWQDIFASQGSK
jgi:hypothetical protein